MSPRNPSSSSAKRTTSPPVLLEDVLRVLEDVLRALEPSSELFVMLWTQVTPGRFRVLDARTRRDTANFVLHPPLSSCLTTRQLQDGTRTPIKRGPPTAERPSTPKTRAGVARLFYPRVP